MNDTDVDLPKYNEYLHSFAKIMTLLSMGLGVAGLIFSSGGILFLGLIMFILFSSDAKYLGLLKNVYSLKNRTDILMIEIDRLKKELYSIEERNKDDNK